MDSQLKLACNFCGSAAEKLTDVEQLEHIRMEHLDRYKPYKCIQCGQNFPMEPKFSEHTIMEHNSRSIPDSRSSSQYLNVLGDLMMQCSFDNAIGETQAATKLIKAVKRDTKNAKINQEAKACRALPFIITFGDDSSNQGAKFPGEQGRSGKKRVTWTDLVCEFCQKTFSSVNSLRAHEDWKHNKVSSGAKKCNNCEQRYHSLYLLRRHQRCHNKEKNGKQSAQPKMQTGGSPNIFETLEQSAGKKPCPHCPMTFDRICDWRLHQDYRHCKVSDGPYKCSVCGNRYYSYCYYKRCHAKSMKKSQTLSCKFCSLKFKNVSFLQKHQDKKHADQGDSLTHVNKKQKPAKKLQKRTSRWCLECKRSFTSSIGYHINTFHIKKKVIGCSECDYRNCWHMTVARRHINSVHKGNGHVVDERESIAAEVQQMGTEIIRCTHGKPMSVQAHQVGRKMLLFGPKPSAERQKWAQCSQCNLAINVKHVRCHLAVKHVAKSCLKCQGCQFSTHWQMRTMRRHIESHHPGRNVGFVDKRHEIGDEIKKLIKQCITFHTKH